MLDLLEALHLLIEELHDFHKNNIELYYSDAVEYDKRYDKLSEDIEMILTKFLSTLADETGIVVEI